MNPEAAAHSRGRQRRLVQTLNGESKIERPLRWAMVGGGRLGQVGYKHRTGR